MEARLDDYWGSGLIMSITATTNPKNYPGSNKLGQLLGELRRELTNNQLQDEETNEPMDVAAEAPNPELTKADPFTNVPIRLKMTRMTKTLLKMLSYNLFHLRLATLKLTLNRMNSLLMTLNNYLILHLLMTLKMI